MHRIKQRTMVVAAALTVLIGGAAMQALAAGPSTVSQSVVAPLLASQPGTTARVIDPASLVAAFADGDAVTAAFAGQTSYADLLRGELASGGASFASTTTAPVLDLATLAAAVNSQSAAPATLSGTVSYASSLRAAHLNRDASFQLTQQVVALDLEGLAAALSDDAAEQVAFADGESQLGEAYFNPGLVGSFASDLATTPGRGLSNLAAAVTGGSAQEATFAGQPAGAEDPRTAYFSNELGTAAFAGEFGGAAAPVSLADLAVAAGGGDAPASFSAQTSTSSYADTLRAAHTGFVGFDAGFSSQVGSVSSQFDLDALADAFSED